MAGRFGGILDLLPAGMARTLARNPDAMMRLERAAARGPDALNAEVRAMSGEMEVGSPMWDEMSRSADMNNPAKQRQRANIRPGGGRGPNPTGDLQRIAADATETKNARAAKTRQQTQRVNSRMADAAATAGAVGAAYGVGAFQRGMDDDLTESGNPADLRDVPVSADFMADTMGGMSERDLITPVAMPKPEPVDYSMQARKMIDQLNAMRRKAGGEVPEAQAMTAEIQRLLDMGNKQRNTPGYQIPKADPARDPFQEARSLIDQVNAMTRQGMPMGHPQIQQIMARVRQLQAEGDAIRNRGGR